MQAFLFNITCHSTSVPFYCLFVSASLAKHNCLCLQSKGQTTWRGNSSAFLLPRRRRRWCIDAGLQRQQRVSALQRHEMTTERRTLFTVGRALRHRHTPTSFVPVVQNEYIYNTRRRRWASAVSYKQDRIGLGSPTWMTKKPQQQQQQPLKGSHPHILT